MQYAGKSTPFYFKFQAIMNFQNGNIQGLLFGNGYR
jgi:hypothetical protein